MEEGSQPGTRLRAVVVDAAADVPRVERIGAPWRVAPDVWMIDGERFEDEGEPSHRLTTAMLRGARVDVTASDAEVFDRIYGDLAGCERVFSVHSSRHLSPAVVAAAEASSRHDNVFVVETDVMGIGVGLLATRVAELIAEGSATVAIETYLDDAASRLHFLAVPNRVDPAGRRRRSAARLLAGEPVTTAHGGALITRSRVRTRRATLTAVERHFAEHTEPGRRVHLAIGHADAASAVDPLVDLLERVRPDLRVALVGRVGPRLVRRLGTRCVGLAWLVE